MKENALIEGKINSNTINNFDGTFDFLSNEEKEAAEKVIKDLRAQKQKEQNKKQKRKDELESYHRAAFIFNNLNFEDKQPLIKILRALPFYAVKYHDAMCEIISSCDIEELFHLMYQHENY